MSISIVQRLLYAWLPIAVFGRHSRHSPESPPATLYFSTQDDHKFALTLHYGDQDIHNIAVLAGATNTSVEPIENCNANRISTRLVNQQVVEVTVETQSNFVGASFAHSSKSEIFGVWEYPWNMSLSNKGTVFELKGVGFEDNGINWSNARAPFFFTDEGFAVYVDTLAMGSFDFSQDGISRFVFSGSTLTYYIIVARAEGDYKNILEAYANLSSTVEMPPDSAYGPVFWSDDFETDFHAGVQNAQDNYYDVVNHLESLQIHASAMFADRPYGTGNNSWGNFDFDPVYYPTPEKFIANLSSHGFDFQVWVANRAFRDTELYNVSRGNGWLFPITERSDLLGPALNLSIPEAYKFFKDRLSYFPSIGVKGFKIDRGEEGEMPVEEQNIQATLFEQLCYETMVEKWGNDYYNYARSAVDRSRSKTGVWNGDSHSNYTGLAYSVASGIRAGLIGFSNWGSDTGGYVRGTNDPGEELWARWQWFSCFSPVYEIMIGTNHTPWYPPYSNELVQVLQQTANLHHALVPYIRSYTYIAHRTGVPVIRGTLLEVPDDLRTHSLADEYFFGSEFLVAPIVSEGGNRTVYFPQGSKYLDYFTKGAVFAGGSSAHVAMDIHSVPAYVRAGAIVPRGYVARANDRWTEDWKPELTLELFPSRGVPRSSFLYYNPISKNTTLIEMTVSKETGNVSVSYGPMDVSGKIELFSKKGSTTKPYVTTGGFVDFGSVESLFDE